MRKPHLIDYLKLLGVAVALGLAGCSAEADKAVSCASSELVYPFGPLERPKFQRAIASFKATGWTPLAVSLDAAGHDFERFDPATSSNFVYVVTDGLETCDGDPVASAQALHAAGVHPLVNIVGFDVDAEAAQQLRAAAVAGGGSSTRRTTRTSSTATSSRLSTGRRGRPTTTASSGRRATSTTPSFGIRTTATTA